MANVLILFQYLVMVGYAIVKTSPIISIFGCAFDVIGEIIFCVFSRSQGNDS